MKRSAIPAVIDCHAHIYPQAVIDNVLSIDGLAEFLHLDVNAVAGRTDHAALKCEADAAGVHACLLLPVAPARRVRETNDQFLRIAAESAGFFTAGAMHPFLPGIDEELEKLSSHGVRALKLSSFSQKFDLESQEAVRLFEKIQKNNLTRKQRFFVILDTFYRADHFFQASKNFLTTPKKLARLAERFPEIDFVAAHMGGLAAPFHEIEQCLAPRNNLYLDTSNAAHMLSRDEFIRLITLHGAERILFGTDWPWFSHKEEAAFIRALLKEAKFSPQEQSHVFSGNISRLLAI
jgi:uncharacterized protein